MARTPHAQVQDPPRRAAPRPASPDRRRPPADEPELTEQQALAEARRRWGPTGAVRLRPPSRHEDNQPPGRLARYRYLVGNGGLGPQCSILGQGDSWSSAFADAKARPGLGGPRPG